MVAPSVVRPSERRASGRASAPFLARSLPLDELVSALRTPQSSPVINFFLFMRSRFLYTAPSRVATTDSFFDALSAQSGKSGVTSISIYEHRWSRLVVSLTNCPTRERLLPSHSQQAKNVLVKRSTREHHNFSSSR